LGRFSRALPAFSREGTQGYGRMFLQEQANKELPIGGRSSTMQAAGARVGVLRNLLNLHRGVNGEFGKADSRSLGGGRVFGYDLKVRTGAIHLVRVAVAARPAHGHGARGNEFVERSAFAVQRDVSPFRLSDLQKIAAHAGESNSLRGRGPGVRRGHLFQINLIHPEKDGRGNQYQCESTHCSIVQPLWDVRATISAPVVSR